MGTSSSAFVEASLFQLQAAARLPGGGISEVGVNSALALIEGAAPKDEIEGALAKTRAGTPCQRPPIEGRKRCRLHGGLSPGAPRGSRNGNYRRGDWTTEMRQERKWVRELLRLVLKPENP